MKYADNLSNFQQRFKVIKDEVGVTDDLVMDLYDLGIRGTLTPKGTEAREGHDFMLEFSSKLGQKRPKPLKVTLLVQAKIMNLGGVFPIISYPKKGKFLPKRPMQCELLNQAILDYARKLEKDESAYVNGGYVLYGNPRGLLYVPISIMHRWYKKSYNDLLEENGEAPTVGAMNKALTACVLAVTDDHPLELMLKSTLKVPKIDLAGNKRWPPLEPL
ncbi:hypothetical protein RhiJN_23425 [Ceratobasidium sp. AG-Ba]|nr:hypothetical protein RhiJN_23425 [Ceratobasidium sp. AG-Ba]